MDHRVKPGGDEESAHGRAHRVAATPSHCSLIGIFLWC
jgi:hypothetical protein